MVLRQRDLNSIPGKRSKFSLVLSVPTGSGDYKMGAGKYFLEGRVKGSGIADGY
jgi:hypothetical protein